MTKEKIKEIALSLFTQKGYFGTSINDITQSVGISKSSLYSHYSSKDEVFLAIYDDVLNEHKNLFEKLREQSSNMTIYDKLEYHFKEYILFFFRNPEIYLFSNMSLFHIPAELRVKLRDKYLNLEMPYRNTLEEIFKEAIHTGVMKNADPIKKVWSFKSKRDGVLGWLHGSPDLNEESIAEFWEDFWFGVRNI